MLIPQRGRMVYVLGRVAGFTFEGSQGLRFWGGEVTVRTKPPKRSATVPFVTSVCPDTAALLSRLEIAWARLWMACSSCLIREICTPFTTNPNNNPAPQKKTPRTSNPKPLNSKHQTPQRAVRHQRVPRYRRPVPASQ